MLRFDIAGILLDIMSDNHYLKKQFEAFISNRQGNADLKVDFLECDAINKPEGNIVVEQIFKWGIDKDKNGSYYAYLTSEVSDEIIYMLEIDKDWTRVLIKYVKNAPVPEHNFTGFLGETIFRNHILHHDGIIIHSSAINWEGRGIIFSAPSETGKSTQANLWKLHLGAEILNDDRPALRIMEGQPYLFGTPWSGSAHTFSSNFVPLSAIIMLEQADKNAICTLSTEEAIYKVLPRCFLPYHDSGLMDYALNNIEKIIKSTPVYLLKCRPDKGAVDLVYQSVKYGT